MNQSAGELVNLSISQKMKEEVNKTNEQQLNE